MMMEAVKTRLPGGQWKVEVRYPMLIDPGGPGYRVVFTEVYDSLADLEEEQLTIWLKVDMAMKYGVTSF